MGGTEAKQVPWGVERVFYAYGTVPYPFRGEVYTKANFENPNTELRVKELKGRNHFQVPKSVWPDIKWEVDRRRKPVPKMPKRIRRVRKERKYMRASTISGR